jgi:FAD/FMN-containing dehydrogenase
MTTSAHAIPVAKLREELAGEVIAPGDATYDDARAVFLPLFDRKPSVIIRPVDAGEVSRVVALARDSGLELAIRSGGHSSAGHGVSEGGIVLDLSLMKGLEIDPDKEVAWAETGLTAGELTTGAAAAGLGISLGDTASVGIGGLTLGGGVGYMVRKHGLTVDSLLGAEVVTADGELLRANADENPDLYWALRGGGGNFGVATRFQYRLRRVASVIGGMLILPATADVVTGFIEAAEGAAEELSTIANVMTAPPMPFIPAEHQGKPVVFAMLVHVGPADEGERALEPFRSLATPIADMLKPMSYTEIYPPQDDDYRPLAAARTMFIDSVDRSVAQLILDRIEASTAQMAAVQLRVLGGALARVPADATAFAHRQSRIMVNVAAIFESPDEAPAQEAWASAVAGELRQGDSGAYVNFVGDEGESRVRDAYPGPTWDRLTEIKQRYDPTNLFRLNQNVPPAGGG